MDLSKHLPFRSVRLVGTVGIELLGALKTRNLLILRYSKREKNCKNAEPRYVRGTREGSSFWHSCADDHTKRADDS
jgi:hypothetical protein